MTTPLPDPPQTSDPTNFAAKSDAWVAAQKLYQTELDAVQASLSPLGRNMLINGRFQVCQRTPGSVADDVYAHDRWYVLTQTAAIAFSTLSDPENGYTHAMRLTQSQATAQRFGFVQIVEGVNCKHARGSSVTLSGRVRCSASTTIRYAVLAWSGTEDAVTSDFVNNWASTTFTPGNFFNATTLAVVASGSVALAANTWTSLGVITGTPGTTFTNLAVMVWTDTAQAQNVTLDVDAMQLETGGTATPIERRTMAQEFLNCLRYFRIKLGVANSRFLGVNTSTTQAALQVMLEPPMRVPPSLTYSGSAADYQVINASGSTITAASLGGGASSIYSIELLITVTSGLVAGNANVLLPATTNGTVQFASEL